MSILKRYVATTILTYTALVVLVVIGIAFIIGLLGEIRDVGTGDYTFWQAVLHVTFRMPYTIYQFSPMLVLLGSIIGLGLLASSQELMVMRTSGVSLSQMMAAISFAALILVIVITLLGELLAPSANFLANKRKDSAENGGQAVATASGVWLHEGNNFLHIDRVVGQKHLEGVTRYEFDDNHHLLAAYYVKVLGFENHQWQLTELVKTQFKNDHTISHSYAHATWDLALNPNLLNVGLVKPDEMSLPRLVKYSKHLTENGEQATRFQFEFWKRIFQPLATFVMMLLALPFVLSSPRSVTMGLRMLLAIVVGFSFYILNAFAGQLCVVYQLSPIIAAIIPTLLFSGLGYILLFKS